MKYALILERNAESCNNTADVVSSAGFLVTPVFSPKKALHAARMIQFDLILTCNAVLQDDRRSLTGELQRCSPDALIVLLADPQAQDGGRQDGVHAVLQRPLAIGELERVLGAGGAAGRRPPAVAGLDAERRKRAID